MGDSTGLDLEEPEDGTCPLVSNKSLLAQQPEQHRLISTYGLPPPAWQASLGTGKATVSVFILILFLESGPAEVWRSREPFRGEEAP
jgi:hypothetical protein